MSAVQKLSATVAALRGVYDEITPEMNPDGDPLFEVAFETAEGVKLFWINSFQYYALHVGMKGELTFQGDHLISFGDVLHA
ncbi:MAG: DUF2500 domain-containing protein [Allobaculum sp.]|nr:DUF2500 domain-containing protein [Allobaculum sp.]